MIWKWFYNQSASRDHGTITSSAVEMLKVIPKRTLSACDDFLKLAINGHVVAAAMQVLNINGISDIH